MHKTAWSFSFLVVVLLASAFFFRGTVIQTQNTQHAYEGISEVTQVAQVNSMGIDMKNATASDKSILNGGCASDPYQILAQYGCKPGNSYEGCAPGPGGQGGINSGLACRLTKLFEAATKAGCRPRIVSAFRSVAKQRALCGGGKDGCGAPGRSCHQYGLAVDVTCDTLLRRMAPQFQLHFPYSGPHIQCIEHRVAACSPSTPPCKGGGPTTNPGQAGQQQDSGQGSQQPPDGQQAGQPGSGGAPQGGGGQPGSGSEQGMPPGMNPQDQFQKMPDQPQITDPVIDTDMTLTCEPDSVSKGESVTVGWECPAGTRSVGSSSSSVAPLNTKGVVSGSSIVKPQQKTRYTIQCKRGEIVVAKQSCEVAVAAPQSKLTVRFTVEPHEVYAGETVEVTWSSQNARSCTVTGPGVASADKSGRMTSGAIENEETFTIKCRAKTGTGIFTKQETVTIIEEDILYEEATPKSTSGQTGQIQTVFEDPLQEI